MSKEIVIITSFFSINREQWKGFQRSDQQYFEYFKDWACMRNRLIVYLQNEELANEVRAYRESIGLGDRTSIVVIPDFFDIDKELFEGINSITSNSKSKLFRIKQRNPEVWNAPYNYIMTMKPWCGQDAVERGLVSPDETLAWMDFGFNHCEVTYLKESNFDFLWEYDFPHKINFYSLKPLDDRPIFDIVNTLDTYLMGSVFVGPASMWKQLWLIYRESMMELIHCGLVDDDQTLMLMCVRKQPDMFTVTLSDWNMVLYENGASHLLLKPKKPAKKAILAWFSRMNHKRRDMNIALKYLARLFRYYLSFPLH